MPSSFTSLGPGCLRHILPHHSARNMVRIISLFVLKGIFLRPPSFLDIKLSCYLSLSKVYNSFFPLSNAEHLHIKSSFDQSSTFLLTNVNISNFASFRKTRILCLQYVYGGVYKQVEFFQERTRKIFRKALE